MMCLATLAASAVYGPAQKERDEPNQTVVVTPIAGPVGDCGTAVAGCGPGVFCDGQHCGIGSAAIGLRGAWSLAGWQADGGALQSHDDLAATLWSTYGDLSRVQLPAPVQQPRGDVSAITHAERQDIPATVGAVAGATDWRALLSSYGDWSVSTMLRIIACESGGDPNAISPGGYNVGAFQINVIHGYSVEQMTDPVTSTAIAHDIYLSQGYRAWSCY